MAPRLASRAVKTLAAASDVVRRPDGGVVVLLYHRVGAGTGASIDLDPGLFDAQMAALADRGLAASLDDALTRLGAPAPASAGSPDPVVVTFDDGTADFAARALPVLVEHGVPATIYVATDFVERGRPFPGGGTMLSWQALSDAQSTGLVTIGSHTHTHVLLDRASPDVAREELDRSIELIGERVGVAPRHFAYPKARPGSDAADAEVRRRFSSAALAGTRANRYGRTDVHRLARSPIQQADGMRFFERKVLGGMALEDDLRRLVDRRRYAGAVT